VGDQFQNQKAEQVINNDAHPRRIHGLRNLEYGRTLWEIVSIIVSVNIAFKCVNARSTSNDGHDTSLRDERQWSGERYVWNRRFRKVGQSKSAIRLFSGLIKSEFVL
jgi:hypothetical protein